MRGFLKCVSLLRIMALLKMVAGFSFMFCLYCCFFLARLQAEFFITEAELERLEKISEELKVSNKQLKKQLIELNSTVVTLKDALKAKSDSLKSLETSFVSYEIEVMEMQRRQLEKIESLEKTLEKAKRWRRFWCGLACLLFLLCVGFFAIKVFKKKFFLK